MTVSAISQVTSEETASVTAGFVRNGLIYVVWATATANGSNQKLQWKLHTGATFSEVIANFTAPFKNLSVLYLPASDRLLVAWDDDPGDADGHVYTAQFNAVTATLISGPLTVATGFHPSVMFRGSVLDQDVILSYGLRSKGVPYIRYSKDAGTSWGSAVPVLTNQVTNLRDVEIVPFSNSHLSMLQLGDSGRQLVEVGSLSRTRPLSNIAPHPTLTNRYYVVEPCCINASDPSDTLRGSVLISRDASKVFILEGASLGAADTINHLALLDTSTIAPTVVGSNSGTGNGDDITAFAVGATVGAALTNIDLPNAVPAVSADLSDTYVYIAGQSDVTPNVGQLVAYKISDQTNATFVTALAGARSVGVGVPPTGTPVIAAALLESAQETLRIYTENALTPTLQATHKLPMRANAVRVVLTSATVGTIYVSMTDRLNIYALNGLTSPLKLLSSFLLPSGGQFFSTRLAANGNLVCAAGAAGVAIFTTNGRLISQLTPSSLSIPFRTNSTAYPLNSLMRPTQDGNFSAQRYYFKATTGGTSASTEPKFALTGTIADGSVVWTPQALAGPVVTDVAIDQAAKRIYAVGQCGGNQSTNGRVWAISCRELV